ncbi:MAG: general secretion pathway protein GspK [Maricaulaceae bacterium]|nr:general secretion pathway protein GspK [Maricaulaceae bacterium]
MNARRGIVLVAVVAILGGLAAAAALAALAAQVSVRGALADLEQARLRAAVETAAARAAAALSDSDETRRWIADGRAYVFSVDGVDLTVRVLAETGRFDLNQGDPGVLQALLIRLGADFRSAADIAAALRDWRAEAPEGAARRDPAYDAAGLPQPGRRPLMAREEFRRVLGVDSGLYEAARLHLTVSGAAAPEPAFAPRDLLRALNLPASQTERILSARRRGGAPNAGGEAAPSPGARFAVLVEAESASGAMVAREIGLALPGANGLFDVTWRMPLAPGEAAGLLEPDTDR